MSFPEQILPQAIAPITILPPAADVFARRAARLRHLAAAPGADWLARLGDLAEAQQAALAGLDFPSHALPEDFSAVQPALAADENALLAAWPAVYGQLAAAVDAGPLPDAAMLASVRAQFAGTAPAGHASLAGIVAAAALQVVWTRAAQCLIVPPANLSLASTATCPCCGSAPLGSIVLAGAGKSGLRYLECSLCATRWNAVRARCTLCDDPGVENFFGLEEAHPAVKIEACDACHGYIKTCFEDKDVKVEPLADDLATLALDVLVGEQGYARGAPNPFLPA